MTSEAASEGGKPMSKTIVVASCLAVTALLIAACFLCQTPVDNSLLTGEPCEPPCWQGLTPGESTLQEVNEFIRTTRFVNTQTLYRGKLSRGGEVVGVCIQWRSTIGRGRGYNDFAIEGGVLKDIIIYPDYNLTVEELVERYGPPDKFHVTITGLHVPSLRVTLFYPAYGFTASLELPIDDAQLRPESKVLQVWYFQAAPLETFIELGIGHLGSTPDQWLQSLRDWQDYGDIEVP